MKTKNHPDFEEFVGWLTSSIRGRISVVKVSEKGGRVFKKTSRGTASYCYLCTTVTAYDHETDTLHRWVEPTPDKRWAVNVVSSTCTDTFNRQVKNRLELQGFSPSEGEWTTASISMLFDAFWKVMKG